MPVEHYENFPVASFLLPKRLVPAVEAIYAFARSADDLADEGDAAPAERLAALDAYSAGLLAIEGGLYTQGRDQTPDGRGQTPGGSSVSSGAHSNAATEAMFARLAGVIAQHKLPMQPFHDLLSAFKQDVVTTRYADYGTLLDYCDRSANPVGLLMLALYGADTAANVSDSNAICSALQIINFLQDVAVDRQKERIYLPLDDLARFSIEQHELDRVAMDAAFDGKWRALMAFQLRRARSLMLSGSGLARRLPGRIGWELRLVIQGGLRILDRLEAIDYDVFTRRPTLHKGDWVIICWRALRM